MLLFLEYLELLSRVLASKLTRREGAARVWLCYARGATATAPWEPRAAFAAQLPATEEQQERKRKADQFVVNCPVIGVSPYRL